MIAVENLSFSYGTRPILQNVSFSLEQGECVAILGNNGAGKSTLISCIDRLRQPSEGTVTIDGEDLSQFPHSKLARYISYVAQKNEALHSTVFDAVLLGRKPHMDWGPSPEDLDVTEHALKAVGLEDFALRQVSKLSGGEQQKVMLARAIAQETRLMLLDEPTSSLDPRNQYEAMALIRHCAHDHGLAVLVVLHDLNLALRYCDRFLFLQDGKVRSYGGAETVTEELLSEVYSMPMRIYRLDNHFVVIPSS
ncbi:MAG: ABC transporter ATP-binding protein [Oscillospiraceae bacterium]